MTGNTPKLFEISYGKRACIVHTREKLTSVLKFPATGTRAVDINHTLKTQKNKATAKVILQKNIKNLTRVRKSPERGIKIQPPEPETYTSSQKDSTCSIVSFDLSSTTLTSPPTLRKYPYTGGAVRLQWLPAHKTTFCG